MHKAKNRYVTNDLRKDCHVLLFKLSKSNVSSLQENPRGKECSVAAIRNAMKRTRKSLASHLPEKTPNELIQELLELSLQATRKTAHEASKLPIYFGTDVYLNLFKKYLNDLQDNRTEMEKILSERKIDDKLLVPICVYSNHKAVNKDLVVWIIKKYRVTGMGTGEVQIDEQWSEIKEAAEKAIREKNQEIAEAQIQPYSPPEVDNLIVHEENEQIASGGKEAKICYDIHNGPRNSNSDTGTNRDISNENGNFLSGNVSSHDVSSLSNGVCGTSKLENSSVEENWKYRLFPIVAPKIPKSAAVNLMSGGPGYINKLIENNANMFLYKEHTKINGSQNKAEDLGEKSKLKY